MLKKIIFAHCSLILFTSQMAMAGASVPPYQVRLSGGASTVNPTQVNDDLRSKSVEEIKSVPRFTLEANLEALKFMRFGLSYTARLKSTDSLSLKKASFSQESIIGIGRLSIIDNNFLMVDAFGGMGLAKTEYKYNSGYVATSGTLTGSGGKDSYTSLISSYGGSVALGYKKFFIFAEAGVEGVNVSKPERTGVMSDSIQELQFSGPFVGFGIIFYDTPTTSSKKK